MKFIPERLVSLRKELGITKAEAARRLNITPMGYGRYESGEREPSYQTVAFIAQTFHTSIQYLYGETDNSAASTIMISSEKDPELYLLVESLQNDKDMLKRLCAYTKLLMK